MSKVKIAPFISSNCDIILIDFFLLHNEKAEFRDCTKKDCDANLTINLLSY